MAIAEKKGIISNNQETINNLAERVYAAGQKSEWDTFWDAFQESGTRSNYYMAFRGTGWTIDNFKPKYDIIPDYNGTNSSAGQSMFSSASKFGGSLKHALEVAGVILDTKYVRTPNGMFDGATGITELPHIDLSSATSMNNVFYGCGAKAISVTVPDRKVDYNNCFRSSFLENLEITGTLNGTNINVSWSTKLTHKSLLNVLNALADKSGDTSTTWTVTFGSTNLAKLTDEEKQIAQGKGWVLA